MNFLFLLGLFVLVSNPCYAIENSVLLTKLNQALKLKNPIEFKSVPDNENYLFYAETVLKSKLTNFQQNEHQKILELGHNIEKNGNYEKNDFKLAASFSEFIDLWLKSPVKCSSLAESKPILYVNPEILNWSKTAFIKAHLEQNPKRAILILKKTLSVYSSLLDCDLPSIQLAAVYSQIHHLATTWESFHRKVLFSQMERLEILKFKKYFASADYFHKNRQAFLREEFWMIKNLYDLAENMQIKPERKIWMNTLFDIKNIADPVFSEQIKTISTDQLKSSVLKGNWIEFFTLTCSNENLEMESDEKFLEWISTEIKNLPDRSFASSKEIREALSKTRFQLAQTLKSHFAMADISIPSESGWSMSDSNADLLKLNQSLASSTEKLNEKKVMLKSGDSPIGMIMLTLLVQFRSSRSQEYDAEYGYNAYRTLNSLNTIH